MIRKIMTMAIVAIAAFSIAACSRVPPGNVGVEERLMGDNRGIQEEVLTPGLVWHGLGVRIHNFPTFEQNHTWTGDEHFEFNDSAGIRLYASIGISYQIVPDQANVLFERYRMGLNEVTNTYIRNHIRSALIAEAAQLDVETIYGSGRAELLYAVQERVRLALEPLGLQLNNLYWIGRIVVPPAVEQAINDKIAATQRAQQRENEIRQAEAAARIAVAEAEGRAQSMLLEAEARARAIELEGDAIRNNPQVISLREIEKWDGVLPQYYGGSGPVPVLSVDRNRR